MTDRKQLEQAIAALEAQRQSLGDAVVDASLAALRKQLAELEGVQQQRKFATILFMDICGHTAIVRDLDPEDQLALIDPILKRLAAVVDQHGGHIARYQGDGFKAVFGLPEAHENDPDNAVRAGLGILAEASRIAEDLRSREGIEQFQVRVGIDTGLVTSGGGAASEGGDTIKGASVNLAARLESAAAPGTLVISHNTYQHVRGIFNMEQLEPVEARGFSEPVQAYRVISEKPRSFRTRRRGVEGIDTRMIGRDRELDLLQEVFTDALEEGERQIVTIVGEAGVGKSRLLYEFESRVDLQPIAVQLYRGRSHLETRRLPYNLVRSIFDFRFDLRENDSLPIVHEKWLAGFREGLGEEEKVEMRAQILGHLLGIDFSDSPHVAPIMKDPEQLRNRSIVYVVEYFKSVAESAPVLILLEDLHWADDGSLEVLNQLGLRLKDTPVMIAAASRPELFERRPNWFEGRDFHRRVDLKPLSRRVCRGLVGEVLQKLPDVPPELEELVLTQSEGNPFYVEELVKMLIDAGVVQAGEPVWSVDQGKLDEIEVPPTLSGVLQARLERLPGEERALIQQAAVVGRVFWDQVLRYLNLDGDGGLNETVVKNGLGKLREKELIYQLETSTFEDALEYIFKHAVLREVTYEGVLRHLRKSYHRKIAEWLMEQRGDRKKEVVGLIADHLEAAGELEEALDYLRWSGEAAAEKYANQEAIDYYSRALRLAPRTELETRYRLLIERQKLQELIADQEAWWQDLTDLEELADRLNDDVKRMEVGVKWTEYASVNHEAHHIATEKAREVIHRAEELEDEWNTARSYLALGRAYLFSGDYDQPIGPYLEKALTGFRKSADRRWEGRALRTLGIYAQLVQRDHIATQEFTLQALKVSQEVGDVSHMASATNILGLVATYLGQFEEAADYFRQYLAIARDIGNKRQEMWAYENTGEMYLRREDFAAAKHKIEKAIELARELERSISIAAYSIMLGDALLGLKLPVPAIEMYQDALELIHEGTRFRKIWKWAIQVGIIRSKRLLGETGEEKEFVEDFIHALAQEDNSQWHLPATAHVLCVNLLLEWDDDRAMGILERAYEQVMIPARKIEDANLRQSYLGANPYFREILQLWETYGPGDQRRN